MTTEQASNAMSSASSGAAWRPDPLSAAINPVGDRPPPIADPATWELAKQHETRLSTVEGYFAELRRILADFTEPGTAMHTLGTALGLHQPPHEDSG